MDSKGDRSRCPDFVNNETKEVIELFGTYWHRDRILPEGHRHETPEEYIQWYKEAGYTCRVVWIEEEFEDFVNGIQSNGIILIQESHMHG